MTTPPFSREPYIVHHSKTGIFIFLFHFAFMLFFCSCHAVKSENPAPEVPYLEKQINEMDKKLDEVYHRVSMIQFMVDNHERAIKEFEDTIKPEHKNKISSQPISSLGTPDKHPDFRGNIIEESIPASTNVPVPAEKETVVQTPELLYNGALEAYKKGDFNTALAAFSLFAEKYPKHELADNALYWAGECHYSVKDYTKAIMAFKKVIEGYPKGSKIPDALLKTGYSYLALDSKENARVFLKKVVVDFPFSPAGTKAEEMLKRLN